MRWDYGKIYQQIRKSKGLTQEEVCGDFLARSTLARIESGKAIPRFDTMIFLLHQIDMTLEEFKYICNLYQHSERQAILNAYHNLAPVVGVGDLQELKKRCEKYLKTNHSIPIEHILDSLNILILLRKNGVKHSSAEFKHYTQKVWTYLEKQDTWYENDLKLLHTILYHFSIEIIHSISGKILKSLQKYKQYRKIKSSEFSLLSNLSTIYLYNGLKGDCEEITLRTLELAKELKRYDSLGFAQVRLGICRGDDALIENGLALLRLTDEQDLLTMLEEEVKNYR